MRLLHFEFPEFCLTGLEFFFQDLKPSLDLLLHNFSTLELAEPRDCLL